jgi:hypothetical protein
MKDSEDMKNIEDIIRNNKDFFEDAEPSTGHFERFNRKLEMRFQVNAVKRSIVPYLSESGSSNTADNTIFTLDMGSFIRPGRSRMTLGQVSPQYKEVENYYVHQVNLMEGEIVNVDLKNNPATKNNAPERDEKHGFNIHVLSAERTEG